MSERPPPLHITLDGRNFEIYELDSIESIKIRISANQTLRDGRPIPRCPRPLLPNLITLRETEDVKTEEKIIAGCKAIHIRREEDEAKHPLQGRKFKLIDFYSVASARLATARTDPKKYKETVDELMKLFDIKEQRDCVNYIVFFVLGGTEALNPANPGGNTELKIGFSRALEETLDLGNWEIFSLEYEGEVGTITRKVEENIKAYRKDLESFQRFQREMNFEPYRTSNMQVTLTRLLVKFELQTDIYELFDGIELSPNVPFVGVGEFFKVLKTFKPPKEWAEKYEQEDLLTLKVLNKLREPEKNRDRPNPKNYSTVYITPTETDEKTQSTKIEMEIESRVDDELREENLLERIFSVFPRNSEIKTCTYEQKYIDAEYLIPTSNPLEIPLFYDMTMNDPTVSPILVIDESTRTFRERGGIFSYFRYNRHTNYKNFVSVHINSGYAEPKQQGRAPDLFQLGDKYISVKMSSVRTTTEATRLQTIINKILSYYYEEDANNTGKSRTQILRKDYDLLFTNFDELAQSLETRKARAPIRGEMLKDYDPEMFISGYQRFCSSQPTIIDSQKEYEKAVAEGKDVMRFPLYGEGPTRVYTCNHPKAPHVGLKINKLRNRDKFPYLPCCESKDQRDNPSRPRWQYENQEKLEPTEKQREKASPVFFTSHKIIPRDNYSYGILPANVDKFLRNIDNPLKSFPWKYNKYPFARQGTLKGKNSALDAIIKAVNNFYEDIEGETQKETNDLKNSYRNFIASRLPSGILKDIFTEYEAMSNKEKEEYLSKIRKQLSSLVPSNITAQSTYNYELRAVMEYINNDNQYLDVHLAWRLLEEAFGINIFLFEKNSENPLGTLSSPYHLQEYLQYKRQDNNKWRFSVMLFETTGAEFEKIDNPQTELIRYLRHWEDGTTNIFSWFTQGKDGILLQRLQDAFNNIYGYNGHENKPIPNIFNSKPLSQCSDFYGKIRLLQFADNICIITEPLPPIDKEDLDPLSTKTKCQLQPVPIEKANEFIKLEQITETRRAKIGDTIVGIECKKLATINSEKTWIEFYIPITPYKITSHSSTENFALPWAPSTLNQESSLNSFNTLARQARYIIEYVTWIFSKWNNSQRNKGTMKQILKQFANEKFQLKTGHEYPKSIPRRFDPNLPGIIYDGKILVSKPSIRNKLIYALQIRLSQNTKEVSEYRNRTHIKNYYQDITDFSFQDNSIILFGTNMVLSWIRSKLPHYVLHDRIIHPPKEDIETIEQTEDNKEDIQTIKNPEVIVDPYFIRLELLPGKFGKIIFLAQHASDIKNALFICKTWTNTGINPGKGTEKVTDKVPFYLISYNSPIEYTIESINGTIPGQPIILHYKYDEEVFVVALLPHNPY